MLFESFFLAFIRCSTYIFLSPPFSQKGVPIHAKVGLAGLLALTVPLLPLEIGSVPAWIGAVLQEIGVGLLFAFALILTFGIIRFAGQLVDVPMGFGMVSIFDPQTGSQMPIFSQFYYMLAMLVFLAIDGHLWIFKAAAASFTYIPLNTFFDTSFTFAAIIELASQIFRIGLQIAAPIMGTILVTDIALGIVTRTVPQINVFVLGFPIKIAVGLFLVILAIPGFVAIAASLFGYDGIVLRLLLGILHSTH